MERIISIKHLKHENSDSGFKVDKTLLIEKQLNDIYLISINTYIRELERLSIERIQTDKKGIEKIINALKKVIKE